MTLFDLRNQHGILLPFYLIEKLRSKFFSVLLSIGLKSCGSKLNVHCSSKICGLKWIKIGNNFFSGKNLWLDAVSKRETETFSPMLEIGDRVAVNSDVHIACVESVKIGDDVLIGSRVYISDHNHGRYDENGDDDSSPRNPPNKRLIHARPVKIGKNVWIGENVSILAGADIGDGCVIGANSVVTGYIPEGSIAVGSPARMIKKYNAHLNKWEKVEKNRSIS